jgi:hypothetical protein
MTTMTSMATTKVEQQSDRKAVLLPFDMKRSVPVAKMTIQVASHSACYVHKRVHNILGKYKEPKHDNKPGGEANTTTTTMVMCEERFQCGEALLSPARFMGTRESQGMDMDVFDSVIKCFHVEMRHEFCVETLS